MSQEKVDKYKKEKANSGGLQWGQVVRSGGQWYKVGSDVEAHI